MSTSIQPIADRNPASGSADSRSPRRRVKAILLCGLLGVAIFLGSGGIGASPAHASGGGTVTTTSDNGSGGPIQP